MPELFKRDWNHCAATSVSPCPGMPRSGSTGSQMQLSSLSRNLSFKMATPPSPWQNGKQLDFQVHDQDSCSTQSTGQSYPEVACVGEGKSCGKTVVLKKSGCPDSHGKSEEGLTRSTLSGQEYTFPPSNIDYSQSYCHGIVAAYGPHSMVHPQMLFMTPTRVPLPLDLPQDEPIYVNAKQYRAILRRRQYRAKLEAQNKLAKVRKPYLHESRHRHALNRARGPGGRFLNKKKLQETNGQDNSGSGHSQVTAKTLEPDLHRLHNYKGGDPATSSSDITTVSNIGSSIYNPKEFGFSFYPYPSRGGAGVPGGTHRYLSVSR